MFGTTDLPSYWRRIFGDPVTQPERYLANSPHLHAGQISTPMLVIHGDKDYRVPVGEALRLWWDLLGQAPDARFLYFPDENHWILKPGRRHRLVRDGPRLPGPARARPGMAASRAAVKMGR